MTCVGGRCPVRQQFACVIGGNADGVFRAFGIVGMMLARYPLASPDDVAAEFRPDGRTLTKSALRTLKELGAISDGVSQAKRDAEGRMHGSVRFYCALNIDAARAARRGEHALAGELAIEAGRVERGQEMTRAVRVACASLASGRNPLVELRTGSGKATAMAKLAAELDRVRRRLLTGSETDAALFGEVGSTDGPMASVWVAELRAHVNISTEDLSDQGSLWVGAPVLVRWEHWGHGKTLLMTEPALALDSFEYLERADVNSPFDRPLPGAGALVEVPSSLSRAAPTMARPRRIPIAD